MFLALFFFPWVLMYALSTLAMNHRARLHRPLRPGAPPYEAERTVRYDGTFSENAPLRDDLADDACRRSTSTALTASAAARTARS